MYLVQELASGGDLFRSKGGGSGKSRTQGDECQTVKQVIIPVLRALQYLHDRVSRRQWCKPSVGYAVRGDGDPPRPR